MWWLIKNVLRQLNLICIICCSTQRIRCSPIQTLCIRFKKMRRNKRVIIFEFIVFEKTFTRVVPSSEKFAYLNLWRGIKKNNPFTSSVKKFLQNNLLCVSFVRFSCEIRLLGRNMVAFFFCKLLTLGAFVSV